MKLKKKVFSQLANLLADYAIPDCSTWTSKYRIIEGAPWSFKQSPWTKTLHDCTDEYVVVMKSAQTGFTEAALNHSLYRIDQFAESVLYIMPTDYVASDFSTSRFDPILQESPRLLSLFSDVHNVQQKRAGTAVFYMRGSNSRSKMKSISTPNIKFDELDEMDETQVRLAEERASGQSTRSIWYISTPTVDNFGVHSKWLLSSQDEFKFICPHCSTWQELIFPDSLVITADDPNSVSIKQSYLQCLHCKHELEHAGKQDWLSTGQWVSTYNDRLMRGFHINQLYSVRLDPWVIARDVLMAETHPYYEQELYNSKMGLPHIVKGAKITLSDIEKCAAGHVCQPDKGKARGKICMGVDVGSNLNIVVGEFIGDSMKLLNAFVVKDFEDLDVYMLRYQVACCVIDNLPETRKSMEFAKRWPGLVHCCIYNHSITGLEISKSETEHRIVVNRTMWMDAAFGRILKGQVQLPLDLSEEYKRQLQAPIRIMKKDKLGGLYAVYVHQESNPDHYAHAQTYCEIANNVSIYTPITSVETRR